MFSADRCESFHPLSKKGKYIITAANNSKSSKGNNVWWSYVDMAGFPISRYFSVFPGISHCPGKYSYFPVYWQPWVQDESLIVHILTPQHSIARSIMHDNTVSVHAV